MPVQCGRLMPVCQVLNFTKPAHQQLPQRRFRVMAYDETTAPVGAVFVKCPNHQMPRRSQVLSNDLGVVPGVGFLRQKMQRSPVVPEIVLIRRHKSGGIGHNPVD